MNALILFLGTMIFTSGAFANVIGTWQGSGVLREELDGVETVYNCSQVQIIILKENDKVLVRMNEEGTNCGDSLNYHFGEIDYGIRGTTLYKYSNQMGEISTNEITAQDRMCFMSRPCEYWNHILAKVNDADELVLDLNFDDYSTSTWKNKFHVVLKRVGQ